MNVETVKRLKDVAITSALALMLITAFGIVVTIINEGLKQRKTQKRQSQFTIEAPSQVIEGVGISIIKHNDSGQRFIISTHWCQPIQNKAATPSGDDIGNPMLFQPIHNGPAFTPNAGKE